MNYKINKPRAQVFQIDFSFFSDLGRRLYGSRFETTESFEQSWAETEILLLEKMAECLDERMKMKKAKDVPLEDLTKEELITKIGKLEKHVQQLKNIIAKQNLEHTREYKNDRKFDFSKYNTRHIALKVLYLGWDYHGYVVQEDTNRTIEVALFDALIRAKLIESRETSSYHRCGRTDKGVSAFSQVISIDVRSNLREGHGVKVREDVLAEKRGGDVTAEVDYIHVLNALLPEEIRVIAWAPVNEEFSARFDCSSRTYKYFFPRGNLNVEAMRQAASRLIGHHDFRNFCKMDVQNGVLVYRRHLNRTEIEVVSMELDQAYEMMVLTVEGNAFLWHQIRCIMAVLLLVGEGKEDVTVIDQLLDVESNPRKPQYALASELPLVLFDCSFENVEWQYDHEDLSDLIKHMQGQWCKHSVRASMVREMLNGLQAKADVLVKNGECQNEAMKFQSDTLLVENKCKVYKNLMERNKCESLEERMAYFAKRRKVELRLSEDSSTDKGQNFISESS